MLADLGAQALGDAASAAAHHFETDPMDKHGLIPTPWREALALAALLIALSPATAFACACGCGVFDVGAGSLLPTGKGLSLKFEYDFVDQNRNWSGSGSAPTQDNPDKEIQSNFYTLGAQYMFNRRWGVMVEAPVWNRRLTMEGDDGGISTISATKFGDVRLMGVYSGFSHDMTTGIILGVKLPTGDYGTPGFDRDTAIGSGSTDLLLGGYHVGSIDKANTWTYFVQGMWQRPVAYSGGYRPGQEFNGAAGVYYNALTLAGGKARIAPVLQVIGSARGADGGPEANPTGSGYTRLMVSPGVEIDAGDWRLYGDVAFPVYQNVNGNQLVARRLFKLTLSHRF